MNPARSMSSHGLLTSARQALERAAVKRRSAATILGLLTGPVQPAGSASASDEPHPCGLPQPCETTMAPSHTVDAPFEQWAALTDAYAEQFLRMQRGDRTARDKAICLSSVMLRMNKAMKCAA